MKIQMHPEFHYQFEVTEVSSGNIVKENLIRVLWISWDTHGCFVCFSCYCKSSLANWMNIHKIYVAHEFSILKYPSNDPTIPELIGSSCMDFNSLLSCQGNIYHTLKHAKRFLLLMPFNTYHFMVLCYVGGKKWSYGKKDQNANFSHCFDCFTIWTNFFIYNSGGSFRTMLGSQIFNLLMICARDESNKWHLPEAFVAGIWRIRISICYFLCNLAKSKNLFLLPTKNLYLGGTWNIPFKRGSNKKTTFLQH